MCVYRCVAMYVLKPVGFQKIEQHHFIVDHLAVDCAVTVN